METNKVTNIDCVEGLKSLPAGCVDLILTDPPYCVDYNKKSQKLSKIRKAKNHQIQRDATFKDELPDLNILSREFYRVLKENTHTYIFCGDSLIGPWQTAMVNAGFKEPQVLVWLKETTTFDMTYGHKYQENKEFILFFQKGWRQLNGYAVERHKFRSVLEFKANSHNKYHSCEKPLDLLTFLIKASSQENDVVLDPFSGSGNHLIASKRLNRSYIGYEISPEYTQTIKKRLEQENQQQKLNF